MRELVFRKYFVALLVLLMLCFLATATYGQSNDPDSSTGQDNDQESSSGSITAPNITGTQNSDGLQGQQGAVPSNQPSNSSAMNTALRNFLQNRPEVMDQLKLMLIQRMRDDGSLVDEQTVTDQVVFQRMQNDPDFRKEAIRSLVEQGYISEDDARRLLNSNQQGNANFPQSREIEQRANTNPEMPPENAAATTNGEETPEGTSGTRQGQKATSTTNLPSTTSPPPQSREPRYDDSSLNPKTLRKTNPYPGLPSTRDLYTQFPQLPKTLKRFGADIFRVDNVGMRNFPMDLPAGPDYVLGPGDSVTINIWGGVTQRVTRQVDREGRISLPDAGPVDVSGLTLVQAQKVVQAALAPQYHDEHVDISVTRLHTVRIYVVGDVQRPGAYDISSLSTPLNALYAAGGPTPTGSLRVVKHYRGQQLISEMDLYDLLLNGVRKAIEHLEPGDTILVPTVGPLVAVTGMVRRPAVYELKSETQISDVIAMAGGVSVAAALGEVKVERIEAHEKRVVLDAKLSAPKEAGSQAAVLAPFVIEDGDRISVSPILPYTDKTVYLQGHVYRPGSYAFKEGMTITDLVHSYQEVLPEPSTHAEIVRLEPPDFRPQTIEVDLANALTGGETVTLQQFDTVWIFGRYEIDPPKVRIYGDVLRPGEYPMSGGMTAGGLVKMAGGFRRSAFLQSADLASYKIEDGSQVITNQQTLKIGAAVSGDSSADIDLKPGDVLTILQIPGWSDIGRSATVKGEVMFPGSYGINEGERLSSLIKRAGGFRPASYPAGAVLERIEVRQMEEKGRQELIRRIEATTSNVHFSAASTGQDQAAILQAVQQQQTQTLARLRSEPAAGRLVITISANISEWENTPADIYLRAGDVITIPRKPNFVLAYGQVYNPTAITYVPGKTADWYLQQAGGPTEMALKKAIYVIRANGSVVSAQGSGWFKGNVLSTRMQPGDVLVVPEKALGGSTAWKSTLETAQLISNLAVAAAVAVHF
jgi:protein involved in polysaccharide export with SLBB domain